MLATASPAATAMAKIKPLLTPGALAAFAGAGWFCSVIRGSSSKARTYPAQSDTRVLVHFRYYGSTFTGERIRDKIAASKKKGFWTGGRDAAWAVAVA